MMTPLSLWAGGFVCLHLLFVWTCRGDANPGHLIFRASIEYFSAEWILGQEDVYGFWSGLFVLCRIGLTLEFLLGCAFVFRPAGSSRIGFLVPFLVLLLIRLFFTGFAFGADYMNL